MNDSKAPSFATDIRPLFTDLDVDHMKPLGVDLSSHDDVAKNADGILAVVTDGTMPPPGTGERWTTEMCDTFQRWVEGGHLP
jgi:hypothetical protein